MISRYDYVPISAIWEDRNRYSLWMKVELAAFKAYTGLSVPYDDLFSSIWITDILAREKILRHDLAAFVEWLEELVERSVGDESRFIHYGLTSSDIVDTAFSMQIREVNMHFNKLLTEISAILSDMGTQYSSFEMLGRTHGQAAELISVGQKFFQWAAALDFHTPAARQQYFGRLAGSVGDHKYFSENSEKKALEALGLSPSPVNDGQVIHRSVFAQYMNQWALIASVVEKIATDIRLLAQTEIGEMTESFAKGQVGSSSMPQKRNPILCENICGLARVVRGYQVTAMQNIALWNERDISHSSADRIIFADASITLGFMLDRLKGILGSLVVNAARMGRNALEHGAGIDSQEEMLYLIREKKMSRKEAHAAMREKTHNRRD